MWTEEASLREGHSKAKAEKVLLLVARSQAGSSWRRKTEEERSQVRWLELPPFPRVPLAQRRTLIAGLCFLSAALTPPEAATL